MSDVKVPAHPDSGEGLPGFRWPSSYLLIVEGGISWLLFL